MKFFIGAALRPVVLSGLLLLGGCSTLMDDRIEITPQQYTVRSGDTLSSISWRYQVDYRTLAAWNGLKPPYTIYPGQRLFLNSPRHFSSAQKTNPSPPQRPAEVAVPPGVVQSYPYTGRPVATPRAPVTQPPAQAPAQRVMGWVWPAQGRIVRRFSSAASGGSGGLDITGVEGQAVFAANSGSVVYSGSGLKGYGELIIIKHSDDLLSAYGHNRRRFVNEGDSVVAGQRIAEMGKPNVGSAILHFEIRRNGKPVDPLGFLPAASQ